MPPNRNHLAWVSAHQLHHVACILLDHTILSRHPIVHSLCITPLTSAMTTCASVDTCTLSAPWNRRVTAVPSGKLHLTFDAGLTPFSGSSGRLVHAYPTHMSTIVADGKCVVDLSPCRHYLTMLLLDMLLLLHSCLLLCRCRCHGLCFLLLMGLGAYCHSTSHNLTIELACCCCSRAWSSARARSNSPSCSVFSISLT